MDGGNIREQTRRLRCISPREAELLFSILSPMTAPKVQIE